MHRVRRSVRSERGCDGVRTRTAAEPDDAASTHERILVVEEHALLAEGLRLAVSEMGYVVEASTGPTACDVLDHVERFRPGCVLSDIHFRNGIGSGITLIEPLLESGAQVVMLTTERRRSILAECLEAGAAGWIERNAALDQVDAMLRRVLAGEALIGKTTRAALLEQLSLERARRANERAVFDRLTEREALVLAALTDGLTAQEIAREHFVALTTVRSQIRAVLQKLDVRSQLAAVAVGSAHRAQLPETGFEKRDRRRSSESDRDLERLERDTKVRARIA
jgi:two-component system nitrate/nitrite response regulator NarL